jgi:hypothetical protein
MTLWQTLDCAGGCDTEASLAPPLLKCQIVSDRMRFH